MLAVYISLLLLWQPPLSPEFCQRCKGLCVSVSPWWVLSICAFGLMGCLAALGSLMGSRKVVIL